MEYRNLPTQERILLAAEKLFAEKGYKETTTREIVREAGASLSSLQAHFQGKENVYFEVRSRAIRELDELMRPCMEEVRYLDQQGMLYGEMAWNLLSELISRYADWCFDPENRHVIILVNRELMDGAPVEGLPEEAIANSFIVMQLLCRRYAQTESAGWPAVIGQIVFSALLSFACYDAQLVRESRAGKKQFRCFSPPQPWEETKYQVKSYILLSLRAYLDIRRKDGEKSAGRESADTVES